MTLLVQQNGEGDALQAFTGRTNVTALILHLYKSNTTPAETDTAATYTESTFTGYAAITLAAASWNAPTEGAPSNITFAQQTFTSSANQVLENAYGYFMTRTTSGRIALSERFSDGPYGIVNLNDNVKITPTITCD